MNLTAEERRELLSAPTAKERKAIWNRLRREKRSAAAEERYWDAVVFRQERD